MKRRHREALATLGIRSESYFLDSCGLDCDHQTDAEHTLPRWGITLEGAFPTMVVEHTPRAHGGDGRYHLRPGKGWNESLGGYRRQQDAIAAYLSRVTGRRRIA